MLMRNCVSAENREKCRDWMMKNSKDYLKSVLSFIITIIAFILGGILFFQGIKFFMPFVIGWIIAMIANPLVRFAESRMKLVRKHSSMLIIIMVLAAIVGSGYWIGSKVVKEVYSIVEQSSDIYQGLTADFKEVEKNLDHFIRQLPENVQTSIEDFQSEIGSQLASLARTLSEWTVSWASVAAKGLPNALIFIIFTILSAYFFIADRDKILEMGRENTPMFIQRRWNILADNFRAVIGGYFKAQFKIMGIVWVVLSIGFFILKVRFALFVGFLVAFLDMLPFFGTGTALIPWAIFKVLSGDMQEAVGLIIIYLVTQLLRRLIEPKLVGDSIGIDPLSTLIFMYAGYKLAGVLGMILAVPIGAIVINFFKMGLFDDALIGCKRAVEDFYYWLKPKEKEKTGKSKEEIE